MVIPATHNRFYNIFFICALHFGRRTQVRRQSPPLKLLLRQEPPHQVCRYPPPMLTPPTRWIIVQCSTVYEVDHLFFLAHSKFSEGMSLTAWWCLLIDIKCIVDSPGWNQQLFQTNAFFILEVIVFSRLMSESFFSVLLRCLWKNLIKIAHRSNTDFYPFPSHEFAFLE